MAGPPPPPPRLAERPDGAEPVLELGHAEAVVAVEVQPPWRRFSAAQTGAELLSTALKPALTGSKHTILETV
jgi:hypothetical protein